MPLHDRETAGLGQVWSQGTNRVLVAKQTFDLASGSPVPAADPLPLVGMDEYEGEPEQSPVRYESDFVPPKPRADLLCVGQAWAPRGEPASEVVVTFGVGRFEKKIRVLGDRLWQKKLLGLVHVPSSPQPFVSLPLSYERAFGGKDGKYSFEANPLGRGFHRSVTGLSGKPLPNLEDPDDPIGHWRHRPAPCSFGPVGRAWLPRRALVGTFPKKWAQQEEPGLPEDFDDRFYNGAPLDQQLEGYLQGDESVRATNLHPEHPELSFRLPGTRLRCLVADEEHTGFTGEARLSCDTLWLDMEALRLVLVWRGSLPRAVDAPEPDLWIVSDQIGDDSPTDRWLPDLERQRADESEADLEVAAAERELAEQSESG